MSDQEEGKELNNALASLERCCPGSTCDSNLQDSSKELHLALLELERAREESDALLGGIKSIISSDSSQQAFTMVLEQLKELISFDDAFVLRLQQDTEMLTVVASTSPIYLESKWPAGPVFKKVLAGTTYNFGNINECPEWLDQGPAILGNVSSALHAPFYTKTEKAICICVSSQKKFFNRTHVKILERFSPLAGQVLYNLEISELLRDEVAERKKAEESLQVSNRKLKEALATIRETREEIIKTEKLAVVGQMAGVVAHEVLNPITSVLLRVEKSFDQSLKKQMVIQKLMKITSELTQGNDQNTLRDLELLVKIAEALHLSQQESHDDLEFIQKQISRINKIINGLKNHSKLKKDIQPVNLAEMIREVLEDFSDILKRTGITATTDLDSNCTILADRYEIYSIFSNLTRNAIQAINKIKPEQTAERNMKVSLQLTPDGFSETLFMDSGIGIQQGDWENIFQWNFTSKGADGTGLGLAYSRRLARSYSGDIKVVDSQPDQGTTFQVVLKNDENQRGS